MRCWDRPAIMLGPDEKVENVLILGKAPRLSEDGRQLDSNISLFYVLIIGFFDSFHVSCDHQKKIVLAAIKELFIGLYFGDLNA